MKIKNVKWNVVYNILQIQFKIVKNVIKVVSIVMVHNILIALNALN